MQLDDCLKNEKEVIHYPFKSKYKRFPGLTSWKLQVVTILRDVVKIFEENKS